MIIFDIYRSGYRRGYEHGYKKLRRRAIWELYLTCLLLWMPFTDKSSYIEGYRQGYHDASMTNGFGRVLR